MPTAASHDAVVVGAGPNGLAAAVEIAATGRSVLVVEGEATIGGGCRTAALTLPGFAHDVCSAIHPLGACSPHFATLPALGLEWIQPEVAVAHPFDDGTAAALHRCMDDTARGLGADAAAWQRLFSPLVEAWPALLDQLMDPLRVPRHPFTLARFGALAVRSAAGLGRRRFVTPAAAALLGGLAAHAFLPLTSPLTAGFGLVLGAAGHAVGWPLPRGGSQSIADALAAHLRALGGEITTGWRVRSLDELPRASATLLDVTPGQLVALAGERLPARYRRRLARFRHGPAAFKVDYALDGPVPWTAEVCRRAGTVHLGGTFTELARNESLVAAGQVPERPFTLVAQQSLFDPSRAPAGRHTLWAYGHVPSGCSRDMTAAITAQVERFAPGFRERILASRSAGPAELEAYNPNYVGGDIAGGAHDGLQLFARPVASLRPHRTPLDGVFLCSASTVPGAGVHGACGVLAARTALRTSLR